MDPECDGDRDYAQCFWERAIGAEDHDERLVSGPYIRGFCEGAMDIWQAVKDQL